MTSSQRHTNCLRPPRWPIAGDRSGCRSTRGAGDSAGLTGSSAWPAAARPARTALSATAASVGQAQHVARRVDAVRQAIREPFAQSLVEARHGAGPASSAIAGSGRMAIATRSHAIACVAARRPEPRPVDVGAAACLERRGSPCQHGDAGRGERQAVRVRSSRHPRHGRRRARRPRTPPRRSSAAARQPWSSSVTTTTRSPAATPCRCREAEDPRGEHDPRQVVRAEHGGLLAGAGRDDDLPRADAQEQRVLEHADEAALVDADRGGPGEVLDRDSAATRSASRVAASIPLAAAIRSSPATGRIRYRRCPPSRSPSSTSTTRCPERTRPRAPRDSPPARRR